MAIFPGVASPKFEPVVPLTQSSTDPAKYNVVYHDSESSQSISFDSTLQTQLFAEGANPYFSVGQPGTLR